MQHAYHEDLAYYEDRAAGLLASAQDGTPAAVAAFAGAELTVAGARVAVARAHGLESWKGLRTHVAGLRASGAAFARAYRALEAHDVDGLRRVLDAAPEITAAEGTNGNDLLSMATATCDERTVALLLERGADPTHANAHGWTPLHQAGYADMPLLARMLLDAGARPDVFGRGDGGTPLIAALFWGNVAVAAVLLTAGVHPRNLRAAAGAGDLELVRELLSTSSAGAHRGFYRPHSGFPPWAPSEDPQEVLDEALAWAARSDRVQASEELAGAGARLDADVYRGTPLTWAAARGRVAAVGCLLALGADPNARGTFGGPTHGEGVTALHLAAESGSAEVVSALLDAGADPSAVDDHGYGDPSGWAAHGGHTELAELIRRRS